MSATAETEKSDPAGALDIATQVVSIGVAVLGATGYVLVLGAVVLWLRLKHAHLPTEVPLSLASREELLVMGAQALALWLLLVAVVATLTLRRRTASMLQRQLWWVAFSVGLLLALSAFGASQRHLWWWWLAPAAVLGFVAFGALRYRPPVSLLALLLLPAGAGVVLVWGSGALADHNRWWTLIGAGVTIAAVELTVPTLRSRRALHAANQQALAQLAAAPASGAQPARVTQATLERLAVELSGNAGAAAEPRSLHAMLRWLALAAVGLFGLGVVAVASQLDKQHDFRTVLVSMTKGRCLFGTYITRDADNVVMADRQAGLPSRAVVIPASVVKDIQVNGTRARVRALRVESCDHKDAIVAPDGAGAQWFRVPQPASAGSTSEAVGLRGSVP